MREEINTITYQNNPVRDLKMGKGWDPNFGQLIYFSKKDCRPAKSSQRSSDPKIPILDVPQIFFRKFHVLS